MIYFVLVTSFTVVFQNKIVGVLSQEALTAEKLIPGYPNYDALHKKAEEILFNPILNKLEDNFSHFKNNVSGSMKSRRDMDAQFKDFMTMLELEAGIVESPVPDGKRTKRHVNKVMNYLNKMDEKQRIRYKRSIQSQRQAVVDLIKKVYTRSIQNSDRKPPEPKSNKVAEMHVKANEVDELEDDDFFKDMAKTKKPVDFKSNMLLQMLLAGNKIKTGVERKMGGVKEIATGTSDIGEGIFGFLKAGTSTAGHALFG